MLRPLPRVLQVLVPTSQFLRSLVAARLAADVLDVPTLVIARTDAHSASLLTSDVDEVDRKFCTGERTPEGFFKITPGVKVSAADGPSMVAKFLSSLLITAVVCTWWYPAACCHVDLQVPWWRPVSTAPTWTLAQTGVVLVHINSSWKALCRSIAPVVLVLSCAVALPALAASPTQMLQASIARGLAYAPYADLLWMETDKPSLEEAKEFADAIHAKYPGKMLAYNCSPSFNWEKHLNKQQLDTFCKVNCYAALWGPEQWLCVIAFLAVPT